MSIDITVQPIDISISVPTDEDIEKGANAVNLNITAGLILPFSTAPGQPPLIVPLGVIHFPIGREQGENLAEKLVEEVQRLPKPSSIITASSLEGADKITEFEGKLRGKDLQ